MKENVNQKVVSSGEYFTMPDIPKKPALQKIKEGYSNWIFLLPAIIGLGVFTLYPILMSLVYSFSNFNGFAMTKYNVYNYFEIFDFSEFAFGNDVWASFKVTTIYAVIGIPLSMVLSFILALALHKNIPGIKALRLLFYLPVLIPSIVSGQIWTDLLGFPPNGLINQTLMSMGIRPGYFFSHESSSLATLLTISQWGIGGGMIVWLAALSGIQPSLYEAADIDGAGYFKKLIKITIPMCTPMIFYNLVSAIIGSLQVFDTYSYLGTGVDGELNFIAIRIYETAFLQSKYGLACAVAWVLFVIIGILTLIMFKSSKWVFYDEG